MEEKKAPGEQRINAAPVRKAPVKKPEVGGAAVKKTPAKKPEGEGAPVKKAPVKKPETGTAAVKKTPAKKAAPGKKKGASKRKVRRMRKIRRLAIGGAAVLLAALTVFLQTTAVIGGKIYPLSAQRIDLSGQGLTSAKGIARLTKLKEADLSENLLTDAERLSTLTECGYMDLTGNPVSMESYGKLREALPGSLILCEAEDSVTTAMYLGGYELPDAEALSRVFASHRALRLVDLRGTGMAEAEASELKERFPHIRFIGPTGEQTKVIRVREGMDAAKEIGKEAGEAHITVTGRVFSAEEYRALKEANPGAELDCLIDVNGEAVSSRAEEIELSGGAEAADMLVAFEKLKRATLGEMLPTEAAKIRDRLSAVELSYRYNGSLVSADTSELDLRGAAGLNAAELSQLLADAPQADTIYMDKPDEALDAVIGANSHRVHFVYEVEAFGRSFSSEDEYINLGDEVTDDDVAELMALIDQLPRLKQADMYESRLSQESMDLLFDSYPDVFFGWTFRMCKGKYVVRTDITAFCTQLGAPMHEYTQDHFEQLRYCKNMLALDLCHNAITDVSFLRNFPKLKLLIIGDNAITDITPMADLKELEFLELFMNYELTDYSPLSSLPNLTDLNVRCPGGGKKLKADPFMSITSLERFWATRRLFTEAEEDRLREALPDCKIKITNEHSTGDGWRDGYQEIIERMFDTRVYEPFE